MGNALRSSRCSKGVTLEIEMLSSKLWRLGLVSSNLILGICFTESNERTGCLFEKRSLHAIGKECNPYEQAIATVGRTLAAFDRDNKIPCFGFGDATTHDQEVFSFKSDHSPCCGFEEVLACYRKIVPNLRLSGPASYAPIIDAAVDIMEKSGGQYHVLVIIADGQVTRSIGTENGDLSPKEKTINSIVTASSYPLSIVFVGVGDGPWDDMKEFDHKLPSRVFDNFQFVNFTAIMSKARSPHKEKAFACAALKGIAIQYEAIKELGLLGHTTGQAAKVVPRLPPVPYSQQPLTSDQLSDLCGSSQHSSELVCPICLTNEPDLAFGCQYLSCRGCASSLSAGYAVLRYRSHLLL